MANYIGAARSNYFEVKDEATFLEWVEKLPGVVAREQGADQDKASPTRYTLLVDDADGGGWPAWRYSDDDSDDEELDLAAELSEHLRPGCVAVLEETGAEKLRHLVGYATAVNHLGEKITVSISDVYEKAKAAGWVDIIEDARY